jgi:predicted transposase/invertase (TIGR01784 family)
MRTDTIQLFLLFDGLLFELLGEPPENAKGYRFSSVEVKEKAFRLDGIFIPDQDDKLLYFAEFQFQLKPDFYWEFLSEITIYLNQYRPSQDWRAVALFPHPSFEPKQLTKYHQELIDSQRILRIYLNELPEGSIGVDLINLIVSSEARVPPLVKKLIERMNREITDGDVKQNIMELLECVLISKFSKLSRQEIEAMFSLSDIKQTRVYQEAKQEGLEAGFQAGRQEGEKQKAQSLVLRLLNRRLGKLNNRLTEAVKSLQTDQLDELAEALLDFTDRSDLEEWLKNNKP